MCNKQSINYFFSGFCSVFRLGIFAAGKIPKVDIAQYLNCVENDLLQAFDKLKEKHERN
jgi:hypothetical protein